MHYGGRRHIERLTDALIALGDTQGATPNDDQRAALDALHSALLCHAKAVPRPLDLCGRDPRAARWRTMNVATSN